MEEINIKENNNYIKKVIIRFAVIVVTGLLFIFLVNYKKYVNNAMTRICYVISIIGLIASTIFFGLMFVEKISEKTKKAFYTFFDLFYIFTLACAAFQMLFAFGYFKANVDGESMFPTLLNNQTLIVRSSNENIDNFDIVVARYDSNINIPSMHLKTGDLLVKRVIAKGGDTFYYLNGVLYLNDERIDEEYCTENFKTFDLSDSKYATEVGPLRYDKETGKYYINEGYYFLMGDNRNNSNDSEELGFFKKEQIIGRVDYELHGIFKWEKIGESRE